MLIYIAASVFAYYYIKFGHMIDQRLTGQIYQNTSRVYSAPGHVFAGRNAARRRSRCYLLRAGYQESAVAGSPGVFV